jgi:hypothetical protein
MTTRRKASVAIALLLRVLALALAAVVCSQAGASADDSPEQRAYESVELSWLADGSRLLVDRRWLLRPEDAHFAPVPCAPERAPGDCAAGEALLAPDGAELLVVDGQSLAFAPLDRPVHAGVPIPRWIAAENLFNVVLWLSADVVFVQQYDPADPLAPACRLFDTRARSWRQPPGGCLTSEFSQLFRVKAGPDRWMLLLSAAEGFHALEVVRFDPAAGQSESGAAPILLEGPGRIDAAFARDGAEVHLLTSCALDGAKPSCDGAAPGSEVRHYSWSIPAGDLRLLRSDLPPGAAFDPVHARYAWPDRDRICIGDPGEASARCFTPPPR